MVRLHLPPAPQRERIHFRVKAKPSAAAHFFVASPPGACSPTRATHAIAFAPRFGASADVDITESRSAHRTRARQALTTILPHPNPPPNHRRLRSSSTSQPPATPSSRASTWTRSGRRKRPSRRPSRASSRQSPILSLASRPAALRFLWRRAQFCDSTTRPAATTRASATRASATRSTTRSSSNTPTRVRASIDEHRLRTRRRRDPPLTRSPPDRSVREIDPRPPTVT